MIIIQYKNMRIMYYKKKKGTFLLSSTKNQKKLWEFLQKTYKINIFMECILLGDVLTCNIRFQFDTAPNVTFQRNMNYVCAACRQCLLADCPLSITTHDSSYHALSENLLRFILSIYFVVELIVATNRNRGCRW